MNNLTINQFRSAFSTNVELPLNKLKSRHLHTVFTDGKIPQYQTGRSSVVFRLTDGTNEYAMKCYITELPGRWDYLKKVENKLREVSADWIVPFEIYADELNISSLTEKGTAHSVILMPWVDGKRLITMVEENAKRNDKNAIKQLTNALIQLAKHQLNNSFSHGDVTPENILVHPNGKLVLVDHDTFGFSEWQQAPYGQAGWSFPYQHPLRNPTQTDEHADEFSFLVLVTSLKAIEINPELFFRYNSSKGMLFTIDDFRNPFNSQLISELQKTDHPLLNRFVNLLIICLNKKITSIPDLDYYFDEKYLDEDEKLITIVADLKKQSHNRFIIPQPIAKVISTKEEETVAALKNSFKEDSDKGNLGQLKKTEEQDTQTLIKLPTALQNQNLSIEEDPIILFDDSANAKIEEAYPVIQPGNIQISTTEFKEQPDFISAKHQTKNMINSVKYQKKRRNVRLTIFAVLSTVLIILLGLKFFYPAAGIIKPEESENNLVENPSNSEIPLKDPQPAKQIMLKADDENAGEQKLNSTNSETEKTVKQLSYVEKSETEAFSKNKIPIVSKRKTTKTNMKSLSSVTFRKGNF